MADPVYILPGNPAYRTDIRKLQNSDPANAETIFNPLFQAVLENIHHLKVAQGTLDYVPNSEKGCANGVATLGADGKIPTSQLQPTADSLNFGPAGTDGLWDRQSSVPTGTQAIRYNGYLRATRVYGMYYSDAADYAEAYPVEGEVLPGELVALCGDGVLRRCGRAMETRIVGIVSSAPAAVIGGEGVPLALAGRVPVRVAGAVKAGDFLCSSEVPGAAKAIALEEAPRGSILGMALEGGDSLVSALVMRL